jgi:hypothetical protein
LGRWNANSPPTQSSVRCTLLYESLYCHNIFIDCDTFLSFSKSINTVTVTGHVRFLDTSIDVRSMLIVVRGNNKVVAKAYTNAARDFTITFARHNERSFKFYCSAPSIGTKLLGIMKTFESDISGITFYVPGRHK